METLKINDLILLSIKRLGINGEGIGYYKRLAVFVQGALVGEEVEVKITEHKGKYAIGTITKIKTKSPYRVNPTYPVLLECGGCTLQIMSYEEQLLQKRNILKEAFQRYYDGTIDDKKFYHTIGTKEIWEYRNKTQLPVRHDGDKVVVGMYQHQSNHLVYLDQYNLENKLLQKAMKEILDYLTKSNIDVYNPRFRQGNLRYLIIRAFEETNEIQVTFVIMKEDKRLINIFKRIISFENIKSVNYSINSDPKASEIINRPIINIAGTERIKTKLHNLEIQTLPESFYPLHSKQAQELFDLVLKTADFKGNEKVVDLYSGIGSVALYIANHVQEVRGIDSDSDNIKLAQENAKINGIENAKFYDGEIIKCLNKFSNEDYEPDLLILNPTRRGVELRILNYLQKAKVKKIIYISSNPSTLAKNINHLQKSYEFKYAVPIDMFPNTPHIETVVILSRV